MAKKSMLERELKRQKLIKKYLKLRQKLSIQAKKSNKLSEKYTYYFQIQKLPRNSSPIRVRNRCWKTGRPRGFFRYFGLCRNALRELSHDCFLPGVIKASW